MSSVGVRSWRGLPVLVTGGTGFVGVNLCRRLVAEGARVTVLSRAADALATPGLPPGVASYRADVREASGVRAALEATAARVLFHLATTPFNPPGTSERQHREVIVGGATAVLAAAGRCATRVVLTGSGAEYGSGTGLREDHPLEAATTLGRMKAEASRLALRASAEGVVDAVVLRLFTPYGPWDRPGRLIVQTALRALDGRPIKISDGRQQRDLTFVDDVVSALMLAATHPVRPGAVYNICSRSGTSVRDVVDMVLEELGSDVPVLVGAIPTRPDEIWQLSGDNFAAARDLGWRPETHLRTGIRRTCAWVRDQRERLMAAEAAFS